MSSRIIRSTRRAAALPFAASLLLFAGAAPALADDQTYSLELHQDLPLTATSDGVETQGRDGCPGVPDGKDGWHFVLPGNSTDFVELTVTFEPGGQQVITEFPPKKNAEKHAYAASEPGAQLVDVQAEVKGDGKKLNWVNLSHTCPAEGTSTTPPVEEPTDEPTEEPTEEPTDEATDEATDEPTPGETEGSPSSPEPTTSEQPDSSPAPAAGGGADGDLAETGAGAPVGALAAGAAALVGAGGYLVLRRRKAAAQQG